MHIVLVNVCHGYALFSLLDAHTFLTRAGLHIFKERPQQIGANHIDTHIYDELVSLRDERCNLLLRRGQHRQK